MTRAILTVIGLTFVFSYIAFFFIKGNSPFLWDISYLDMFDMGNGVEPPPYGYHGEQGMVDYFSDSYKARDFAPARRNFWIATGIIFLLSLVPGYRIYRGSQEGKAETIES